MRFLFPALIAILLAGPGQAATATAQSESDNRGAQHWDLTGIYRAEIFGQSLAAAGTPTLVGMPQAVPQGILDSLSFTTSPEVERATRDKLLASVLEVVEGEERREQVRLTVRSDDLWRQFAAVADQAGLSIYNLADVTAATYLIAWQVLNSNDTGSGAGAAAIRAVRDSIASGMATQGQVAQMTNAQRQEAASVMAYMVTIAANSVNELHRSGNGEALARLRQHLHAVFLSVGADLDRLRLTDQGFVER